MKAKSILALGFLGKLSIVFLDILSLNDKKTKYHTS
jgi:hypothetical protein